MATSAATLAPKRSRIAARWVTCLWFAAAVAPAYAGPGGHAAATPAPAPVPEPVAKAAAMALSDVPGMDFSELPAAAKRELATVFADEFCYCGCPHSLGACLKQHTGCRHAKRMALLAASETAAGVAATDVIIELSKYYQSFSERRASFKVDDRQCFGAKDAPVTLVEYSDFECPFCAVARPMLQDLVKARKTARVCFAPFPLSGHPNAMPAAQAALFARDKGKFWEMHDLLFENQMTLSPTEIRRLASTLGLDPRELGKATDAGKYVDELNASKDAGKAAGVDHTPSVYVNGRLLNLGLSPVMLEHTVDDELEWQANKGAWAAD